MNNNFSYLYDDHGYSVMTTNGKIDRIIPYKEGIEDRLIKFMRTSYYYKIYDIKPCIPLKMEFDIKPKDIDAIKRYGNKYNKNEIINRII